MNSFISMEKDRADTFKDEIEKLFKVEGKIEKIIIVSAYFDLKTIDWIYKFSKDNQDIKIQIFIDRYSSKFFSNKEIYDELIKASQNIEIFLVKSGKLFHSKLYYIKSNKKIKVSIGSLNFTYNAFQKNEEILNVYTEYINKKSRYIKNIETYITSLTDKSEQVTSKIKNNHTNDDLRSLLLDGFIYFESKEQESFSFKLELLDDMKRLSTNIVVLEGSLNDSLNLETLIEKSSNLEKIKCLNKKETKSLWKDYCIETCYGYWSPSYFNKKIKKELAKGAKKRKVRYGKLKNFLETNTIELEEAFLKVHTDIKNETKNINWKYYKTETAIKAWGEWRIKLLKKLNNEKFYNKLIDGISKVSPPDVWNDSILSEEFEDSFLESVRYYWSKEQGQKTRKKIAQMIDYNLKENNRNFDKNQIENKELKEEIGEWLHKYIDNENNIFKEWNYS